MVSRNRSTVYPFRIFPILFVSVLVSGCGVSDIDTNRQVAVNAQLDAISGDPASFIDDLTTLANSYGGDISSRALADPASAEMRIPVARWPEAFADLRVRREAAGGERVWGQDITDQISKLEAELESATGEEAARLRASLDFRFDRMERATIVVRIRPPG